MVSFPPGFDLSLLIADYGAAAAPFVSISVLIVAAAIIIRAFK